jgi:hypothetical protein
MRGARNVVCPVSSEVIASVKVAVTILLLQVEAVQGYNAPVFGNLVESVSPSIGKLRSQAMIGPNFQSCLESIVVGGSNAVELIHGADVGVL